MHTERRTFIDECSSRKREVNEGLVCATRRTHSDGWLHQTQDWRRLETDDLHVTETHADRPTYVQGVGSPHHVPIWRLNLSATYRLSRLETEDKQTKRGARKGKREKDCIVRGNALLECTYTRDYIQQLMS